MNPGAGEMLEWTGGSQVLSTFLDHYCLIFVFKHTIKFEYDITQTARTLFVGGFYWNERVTCIKYIVLGKDMPYLFKMYFDSNK